MYWIKLIIWIIVSSVKVSKRRWCKQYIMYRFSYLIYDIANGCLGLVLCVNFGDNVGKSSVGIVLRTGGGWDGNALSGASHRSCTVGSTEACMSTQQRSKHTTTFRLIRATGCKWTGPANYRCWSFFFFLKVIEIAVRCAFLSRWILIWLS